MWKARIRVAQLKAGGKEADFEAILKEICERDDRDRNRIVAPLKPAEDAVIIDSSNLNIDEVFNKAMKIIERKLQN